MKFSFILITFLICLTGCGRTHNAASVGAGNTTVPANWITYSGFAPGPTYYEGYSFDDQGNTELIATMYAGATMTGWYKFEGTYVKNATDIDFVVTVTGEHNSPLTCGQSFPMTMAYTETATTITFPATTLATYTLESVSGLSRPDLSAFPDECP